MILKVFTIITVNNLNDLRLYVFKEINKNKKFKSNLFNSSKENVELCVEVNSAIVILIYQFNTS